MAKKIILIIFYLIICICIYNKYNYNKTINIKTNIIEKNSKQRIVEQPIGYLKINKINLNEKLYSINSKKNNVDQHVTILNNSSSPDKENTSIFIAAHSGTGKIAYFKNLNKLNINDNIFLNYENKEYTYTIKNIWEVKKTGKISIPKLNTNQLILTTCSPNKKGYQLILDCHIKRTN